MSSHHQINIEDKFRRFLFLRNPSCNFVTGNPDSHFNNHKNEVVIEMIKKHNEKFSQILIEINNEKLLTKRINLIYALALVLTHPEVEQKIKVSISYEQNLVLKICKTDDEFFTFIKYHSKLSPNKRKISKNLRKIITKFYEGKSAQDLAESVRKSSGYYSWKHKDLIKLCHIGTKCPLKKIVLEYILFGVEKIENYAEKNDEATKNIVEHLKKTHQYRRTNDALEAACLLDDFKTVPAINENLVKSDEFWNSAIPKLTTAEILRYLTKFYKAGLLKPGTSTHVKVVEALTNAEKIKNSDLHPVEVFIHLKNFEKGGKPLDPKFLDYLKKKELHSDAYKRITTRNEPKCQLIISNINKCLVQAYSNVHATGKKFLITIDATNKNNNLYCMHNRNIVTLEAVYALTRCILKVEKNASVAVFEDDKITLIDLTKSYTIPKFLQKLQETKNSYITPNAPFEWAMAKKKPIDVFISFLNCDYMCHIPKTNRAKIENPSESLNKYCKKMKAPDTNDQLFASMYILPEFSILFMNYYIIANI